MSREIPLGKREGPRLEFKGSAALKTPEVIARGVVAMLNADGGEVWVGLREEHERAVAVEPISDQEREGRRLLDHLVDAIEPALSKEIEVEPHQSEEGFVLRVVARPQPGRAPYALLKGGGRHFVIRVGPRSRPMTRQELQERFSKQSSTSRPAEEQALEAAKGRLFKDREKIQKAGGQRFWLGLEPTADLNLDVQDPKYMDCLRDPYLTGNRRSGATFVIQLGPGGLQKDCLLLEDERLDSRVVALARHGALAFRASLDALSGGEEQEIWPLALLEYPISGLRIARAVYRDKLPPEGKVVADLSFFGIRGWKLRPYSPYFPLSFWSRSQRPSILVDSDDLLWEKPLVFSAYELENEPDRCGYRLVERVYEAFGFRREQIPEEFDTKSGRLILPE